MTPEQSPPLLAKIRRLIFRHCEAPRQETSLPSLTLFNCPAPTEPRRSLYEPRLCLVFQGAKRVLLGGTCHEVVAGAALLGTIDLPVTAFVTRASAEEPHLALVLTLNRERVAAVASQIGNRRSVEDHGAGLVVRIQHDDLLAPVLRLLELLDQPTDVPILFPLIESEIIYRLLNSDLGSPLAAFAVAEPRLAQITRATEWIRDHYDEPLRIADLAAYVAMSPTSLHRHFKRVTSMTPLQYRRELRLAEARRRLLAGTNGAGKAGMAVGYDSPAQFSREYRRSFGNPPSRSVRALRTS